jgi:hypothetical protein
MTTTRYGLLGEAPTDRLATLRARTNAPRFTWPVGPTTWAESADAVRRRRRRARTSRWLALFVLLAALTAAAVIWQLADGTPLTLLREGRSLVQPAIDRLRSYAA